MPTLSEITRRRSADISEALSPSPENSPSLPREFYFSPEVFEAEKEAIWFKNWIFVGLCSDLKRPGDYFTATVVDQQVYVIRSQDGALRAFYNVCQHRAHTLLEGKGALGRSPVRCPYHSWAYDTFGNLKSAPYAEEVVDFDYGRYCIPEIKVDTLGPMVFVNLDDESAPLSETTGDLLEMFKNAVPNFDALSLVRTAQYDLGCNWKLVLDGLECYHCPFIHPEAMGSGSSYLEKSFAMTAGRFHQQHLSHVKREVVADPSLLPFKVGSSMVDDLYVWYLWPNLLFASRPGDSNWQILETVPLGPEKSVHNLFNFCINNPPNEADVSQMDFYQNILWPQDRAAILRQGMGVRTRGFIRGRYMVDTAHSWWSECGTHHFNKLVWDALKSSHNV
jgi:carnitine monooxygenase subunit